MVNYLFKVYYRGESYPGYQRQLNGQAIENYIEYAFIKSNYIDSFSENYYKGSSRTDAGVSAIANIFRLNLQRRPKLEHINNYLPKDNSIIIWAFAEVDVDFNPRKNSVKQYDYVIYNPEEEILNGMERIYDYIGYHNFSNLIKSHGAGEENPYSNISEIKLIIQQDKIDVSIIGDKFGREQIRRMIGLLFQKKHLDKTIQDILDPSYSISIKPASPDFLTLVDIKYDEVIYWQVSDYLNHIISHEKNYLNQKYTMIQNQIKNFDKFMSLYAENQNQFLI